MRVTRLTDQEIKDVAKKYAENYLVTFGSGTINFDPPISPTEGNRDLSGTNLIFTVKYPYDFLVLSAFGFGQITLRAQTIMRME